MKIPKKIWEIDISHDGLGKYRHIEGSDKYVVEQKARAQKLSWEQQWERKLEVERKANEKAEAAQQKADAREIAALERTNAKEDALLYKEQKKDAAVTKTTAAQAELDAVKSVLLHTLAIDDAVDWDSLKDNSDFPEPSPVLTLPTQPIMGTLGSKPLRVPLPPEPTEQEFKMEPPILDLPIPPSPNSPQFTPKLNLLHTIFPPLRNSVIAARKAEFDKAYLTWDEKCKELQARHDIKLDEYAELAQRHKSAHVEQIKHWELQVGIAESTNLKNASNWQLSMAKEKQKLELRTFEWNLQCEDRRSKHLSAQVRWNERREEFFARRQTMNAEVDECKMRWLAGESGAVLDYCDMVLANSNYPESFPKTWEMDYIEETKTLVLNYELPAPDKLPTLKEVQYIQSRDEFKEISLSSKEIGVLYDNLLYQICLRTIHELFEADLAKAIDAINLNGIVKSNNKATGQNVTSCIMSVHVGKDEFSPINLALVDPKECYKSLRGVAAAQLMGLAAVPPIMVIDRSDSRFVDAYAVADTLAESNNLATMHWEDFEHLIREVFEKEFSSDGGEVKVTRASRDGGVDAVVFDPNPIRGGKIVIQAKRYTNTVGVSAVRDLYGTVMNEGAIKGILVSTANFGPDAYDFAKNKPITLLNGGNLLHILERHGHKAHIDLKAAKAAFNEDRHTK